MKRKRLLSLLFALVLMCSSIFVNVNTAEAKESSEAKTAALTTASMKQNISRDISLETERIGAELAAQTILYSTTSEKALSTYTVNQGEILYVPVTVSYTGVLWLDFSVDAQQAGDVGVVISDDDSYNFVLAPDEDAYNQGCFAVTKGTYYIALFVNTENVASVDVKLRARVYRTGDRTLSQGTSKYTISSGIDSTSNCEIWYKVKPDRTGVMNVTLKEYGNSTSTGYVRLYNSSKKAVSDTVTYHSTNNKVYFGVKKNTTYYLKVSYCYGTAANNYKYGIKYSMSGLTDRSLGSKSSAKTLTRKATATKTLFTASTSSSSDWYKFKVTSRRKTQVTVDTSGIKSGTVTVKLYKGSTLLKTSTINCSSYTGTTITASSAASGTYYVKVTKNSKASGKYTIRYVQ